MSSRAACWAVGAPAVDGRFGDGVKECGLQVAKARRGVWWEKS